VELPVELIAPVRDAIRRRGKRLRARNEETKESAIYPLHERPGFLFQRINRLIQEHWGPAPGLTYNYSVSRASSNYAFLFDSGTGPLANVAVSRRWYREIYCAKKHLHEGQLVLSAGPKRKVLGAWACAKNDQTGPRDPWVICCWPAWRDDGSLKTFEDLFEVAVQKDGSWLTTSRFPSYYRPYPPECREA